MDVTSITPNSQPAQDVFSHSRANVEKFWSNVTKTDTCWLWAAGRTKAGYGSININGKTYRVHRVAWELANGPIPADMGVLHRCDIRHCVNPDHLFLGTHADNMADKVAKGRQAGGREVRHEQPTKLTTDQMIAIRRRYATGTVTQRQLAAEFGCSYITIGRVIGYGTPTQETDIFTIPNAINQAICDLVEAVKQTTLATQEWMGTPVNSIASQKTNRALIRAEQRQKQADTALRQIIVHAIEHAEGQGR